MVDPNAAARQQAAENVRQSSIGSYQGLNTILGNNQSDFTGNAIAGSYGMQNNAGLDLAKLFTQLQEQKTKFRSDTLSEEAKQNQINAAFGLKQKDTLSDNYTQRQSLKERKRHSLESESTARQNAATARKRARDAGKKKSVTDKAARSNQDSWVNAVRMSRKAAKYKGKGEEALTLAITTYGKEYGIPISSAYARIAARRAIKGGGLSPADMKRLVDDGVKP